MKYFVFILFAFVGFSALAQIKHNNFTPLSDKELNSSEVIGEYSDNLYFLNASAKFGNCKLHVMGSDFVKRTIDTRFIQYPELSKYEFLDCRMISDKIYFFLFNESSKMAVVVAMNTEGKIIQKKELKEIKEGFNEYNVVVSSDKAFFMLVSPRVEKYEYCSMTPYVYGKETNRAHILIIDSSINLVYQNNIDLGRKVDHFQVESFAYENEEMCAYIRENKTNERIVSLKKGQNKFIPVLESGSERNLQCFQVNNETGLMNLIVLETSKAELKLKRVQLNAQGVIVISDESSNLFSKFIEHAGFYHIRDVKLIKEDILVLLEPIYLETHTYTYNGQSYSKPMYNHAGILCLKFESDMDLIWSRKINRQAYYHSFINYTDENNLYLLYYEYSANASKAVNEVHDKIAFNNDWKEYKSGYNMMTTIDIQSGGVISKIPVSENWKKFRYYINPAKLKAELTNYTYLPFRRRNIKNNQFLYFGTSQP